MLFHLPAFCVDLGSECNYCESDLDLDSLLKLYLPHVVALISLHTIRNYLRATYIVIVYMYIYMYMYLNEYKCKCFTIKPQNYNVKTSRRKNLVFHLFEI